MIVDLVLAVARGAAELPAFAALLGVRLAHPRAQRPDQLGAVRPQIDVVAGVRAELAPRAVVLAHAAWLTGHVGQAQTTPIVPAAEQKHADFIRQCPALRKEEAALKNDQKTIKVFSFRKKFNIFELFQTVQDNFKTHLSK